VRLEALPYHVEAANHLSAHEEALWGWFESDAFSAERAEGVKLELLKSTYRLARADAGGLYALADAAVEKLGLDLPVTIYQRQGGPAEANAALVFLPDELAVMLMGGAADLLSEPEMLALLGHEFSHRLLYTFDDGRYFTAARLLEHAREHPHCASAYRETDRLYRLHSEIFADAGALHVSQDRDAAISCLIKVATGLKTVSPASYLEQADEILEKYKQGSEGLTHPELFIRARALELAASGSGGADEIGALLRGPLETSRLDLIGQHELSELTRKVIFLIAEHAFMRSERAAILGQRYFPGSYWPDGGDGDALEQAAGLAARIAAMGKSTHDYLCYVLLDFATVNPGDENDAGLVWTIELADRLGLYALYEALVRKELKRKKDDLTKMRRASAYKIAKANHA
jgi:hypothetical protein